MLLPEATFCSEGVANFDPSCHKVDLHQSTYGSEGVASFNVMMVMM